MGVDARGTHERAQISLYVIDWNLILTPKRSTAGAYQNEQAFFAIPSDSTLDYEITLNSTTNKIDQKIYLNGVLTSEQSDSEGMKPAVFYSGNECYEYGCGTLPAYSKPPTTPTPPRRITL